MAVSRPWLRSSRLLAFRSPLLSLLLDLGCWPLVASADGSRPAAESEPTDTEQRGLFFQGPFSLGDRRLPCRNYPAVLLCDPCRMSRRSIPSRRIPMRPSKQAL